jgi:hypothetical protein
LPSRARTVAISTLGVWRGSLARKSPRDLLRHLSGLIAQTGMSVTDLDPALRLLHDHSLAAPRAGAVASEPATAPVAEAAANLPEPAKATDASPLRGAIAPTDGLDRVDDAAHDDDLEPADLDDPLDDTSDAFDFDDEPGARVTTDGDDEAPAVDSAGARARAQLPEVTDPTAGTPTGAPGGAFADFTPPIPAAPPRAATATVIVDAGAPETAPREAARSPQELTARLTGRCGRPRRLTVIGLVLLALVVLVTATGSGKPSGPPPAAPTAAIPAPTATTRARKTMHRTPGRAARSRGHRTAHHPRAPRLSRVAAPRAAAPVASAPAAPAPTSDRRSQRAPSPAAGPSEFRP